MPEKWSTWVGAVGEIRCARCGASRSGSDPHTCLVKTQALWQEAEKHKVETSPMARHLLRRRTKDMADNMPLTSSPNPGPQRPPWVQGPALAELQAPLDLTLSASSARGGAGSEGDGGGGAGGGDGSGGGAGGDGGGGGGGSHLSPHR